MHNIMTFTLQLLAALQMNYYSVLKQLSPLSVLLSVRMA